MAQVKIQLIHGLKIGDETLKEAVIRETTVSDLLDAEEESERLVPTPKAGGGVDYVLVLSPSQFGINIFRRQILKIGDVSGPFEISDIKKLHTEDLDLLQREAEKLDKASDAKEVAKAVTSKGED